MQGMRTQGNDQGFRNVQPWPQGAVVVQALPGRGYKTVDEVARWAFALGERSAVKVADYAPNVAASTGEKFTMLEQRGQAALIVRTIRALPVEQANYMLAAYAWGDALGALEWLTVRALKRLPTAHPALTEALVERHIKSVRLIEREGLRLVAARQGVGHQVARTRDEKVRAWLGEVWKDAEQTLLWKWEQTGVINP